MTEAPEHRAATPNAAADPLSEVLNIVHVRGETALIFAPNAGLTVAVPAGSPGVLVVDGGAVAVQLAGQDPVKVEANQLALLLHGEAYDLHFNGGGPTRTLAELEAGPNPLQVGQGQTTRCFWGRFSFSGDLAARVLQTLPPIIHLTDLEANPIEWLDLGRDIILMEQETARPGASVMVSRLLDLLLVQVLRRWAQTVHDVPNWLAAAQDDRIARAVAAIHTSPEQDWTNTQLADLAGMSRSSFVTRFGQVMGQQPGAYLRAWRLDRAAEALQHSGASVDAIAAQVGYASQEAFSRAFHARFGQSPTAWRNK